MSGAHSCYSCDCFGRFVLPCAEACNRRKYTSRSALDTLPKSEEYSYRHAVKAPATSEVNPGERSDVSWISTEAPDRSKEVVICKGMNDSQFAANPLVTMAHAYWCPPVGKSLWRKRIKDGDTVGIKAKTIYP